MPPFKRKTAYASKRKTPYKAKQVHHVYVPKTELKWTETTWDRTTTDADHNALQTFPNTVGNIAYANKNTGAATVIDASTDNANNLFAESFLCSSAPGVGNTIGGFCPLINRLNVGTGESQRIGNEICLQQFKIKGHLEQRTTINGEIGVEEARLLLVWDKSPNGASTIQLSDVLNTKQTTSVEQFDSNVNAFQNTKTQDRFQILWDHHVAFDKDGDVRQNRIIDATINLPNLKTKFGSDVVMPAVPLTAFGVVGLGGYVNVSTGQLWLIGIGTQPGTEAGNSAIYGGFSARVYYTDM